MTVGMFVGSAVLLLAFVLVEARVKAPLLPLRVITERNRGGIYLSLGLAIIAMFGLFLFLTYYLQIVKGYTPVKTGFAFLPMIAGMITGSTQIGARLMTRVAPRLLMGPGFLVAAVGMLFLTQLEVDTSYAGVLLPGMLLLGLGMGTAFMPAMSMATMGVEARDAGVASAMVNTSQQVGGAIGTALLNTIAASATTSYIADHMGGAASRSQQQLVQLEGQVQGYTSAIWFAVGILVVAAAIALTLITPAPGRRRRHRVRCGRRGRGRAAGAGRRPLRPPRYPLGPLFHPCVRGGDAPYTRFPRTAPAARSAQPGQVRTRFARLKSLATIRMISPRDFCCSGVSRSKTAWRTASTWPGAVRRSTSYPSSVRMANWPRLSEGQSSRRTQPFFSSRATACESRDRVIFAYLASSVIRSRRRGDSASLTSRP